MFKTVCSSVDKLDKEEWADVKKELIQKGVTEEQCDKLWTFVQLKDKPKVLLERLLKDEELINNQKGKTALEDMGILFDYLEICGVDKYCTFDLSLARGLDYYTGLIYETVLTDTDKVGSISGGGRFDNLVGMFSAKPIPAVGVSIGIERIFNILEEKYKDSSEIRSVETEVFVVNGIKAEILYNENPRMDKQMDYIVENRIPFAVFIGENEIQEGKVKIKCLANGNELMVERSKLVEEIKKLKENPELLKIEKVEKKTK